MDNTARIAQIRKILRSGVSSTTVDGESTTFDLASLRKELHQLESEDDTQRTRRPRIASIDLSRLF